MIAKFSIIALLAVVAAAAPAANCGQETSYVVRSSSVAATSAAPAAAPAPLVKKVVAKGKYAVALKNCGPPPERQIPVHTTRVTAPVQEKPTIRLPSNIPSPRVIAHSCTCYKTIVRPRVHQQILTVPTVQRYIQTTHRPVVEHIEYEAVPVNCGESCNDSDRCDFVEAQAASPVAVEPIAIPAAQTANTTPDFEISRLPVFVAPAPAVEEVAPVATTLESFECPRY